MPIPIENYNPQNLAPSMRRQAWLVWGGALFFALLWVGAIVLAPAARAGGWESVAEPFYRFFGFICHQIPSRSLSFDEHRLAVCSRCFGVYFGLFAGFAVYPLFRRIDAIEPLPRFWLLLAMIPISVDWTLGVFGIWENTHLSRFLTGAILGIACAVFIAPALVEIFRILSRKKRVRRP